MGIRATDKDRSTFLKGLNLSRSGKNEDPTYLGFKFLFDFGALPVNLEYGWAPSPLLRVNNYTSSDGASNMPYNLFGQPQYDVSQSNVVYYSAYNYLLQRDGNYASTNALKRANALRQFQNLLADINNNSPWFFQSVIGLDQLEKVAKGGFQTEMGLDSFNSARTANKTLEINCLESLNLRVTALANLYNQATFDADNMRWLVPRNLRKFTMWIFVTEIRNFFKTTRLTGASSAVAQLDDLSSLLSSNRNPGGALSNTPEGERPPVGFDAPGNAFNSFVRGVASQSGLMNEVDAFRNQQDQSGIKPVLIYECHQCEFDFSTSSPFGTIDVGIDPNAASQSFKIHVGKVRMKNQYPNIRTDGGYLVLADAFDQNRSSVQNYGQNLVLEELISAGSEALTNITSQAISDMINEGVSNFASSQLAGINQSTLGNIYSFNPSQLTNTRGANFFGQAQDFLNTAGSLGFNNIQGGNLPNPQTVGLGGPPERVYPPPQGQTDVYTKVPGSDLGVPDRVYPPSEGDAYRNVPGPDLGVPDRVYPTFNSDVYSGVPGPDLGVPDRVYPDFKEDAYSGVPGADLGVPDRVYPAPGGDVYSDVPGSDLGVPDRVYPQPEGDAYERVPGSDLGAPDRVYPAPGGDVYSNVPGSDLGVPERAYPSPGGDAYSGVPGRDLGVPDRVYPEFEDRLYPDPVSNFVPEGNIGRVYRPESPIVSGNELRSPSNTFDTPPAPIYNVISPSYQRGELGKIYPPTSGDFIPMAPVDLGNAKPENKFNISLGTFNPPDSTTDLGALSTQSGVIIPE